MSNLIDTVPFTELWERLLIMARIDSLNNEDFAKGAINDAYTRALPRLDDWTPLIGDSHIVMVPVYETGTVSITSGATAVTGVGTVWTAGMTAEDGYKIKISGNDNIYKFTRASGTTGALSMPFSGSLSASGAKYVIYKDEYTLESDFDRFLKNGSVYVYSSGRVVDTIKEAANDRFKESLCSDVSDPIKDLIIRRVSSSGLRVIQVSPPPKTAKVYPYEYIRRVRPMRDYSIGTVEVESGSDTVLGTDTSWLANISAGDYFRVNGNGIGNSSKWYKVAAVVNNTELTLEENYGEASEGGMEYSVSGSPTAFPVEFHEYILYEALLTVVGEQGDASFEGFGLRRIEILSDLKKNYKSRRTNVQVRVEDDGYR